MKSATLSRVMSRPLMSPMKTPSASVIMMISGVLKNTVQPNRWSIPCKIRPPATIPQKPTIEPTDRSIPPVMITKVMPIARKALRATCFDINTRFSAERKFGTANEKYKITAKSAMKVRSRIRFSVNDPAMALDRRVCAAALIEAIPFAASLRPDRAQLKMRRQSLPGWPRPCRT
jgi:hypothetical protein